MTTRKHAVLGTGMVGKAIANKLISLGQPTKMGARQSGNAAALEWAKGAGELAGEGSFGEVARGADVVWLALKGEHAVGVVESIREELTGRVVLDLTNPLDFSQGFPPRLSVVNDDSLGEQIQRAAPEARVVKTFNTLANTLMVEPQKLTEPTDVFVAGEDAEAKQVAIDILKSFGHEAPIDMGGIAASRGLEAWLLLWTRLYGVLGTPEFNLKLVRVKA
ncbi:MAG: NADPH-dependent F420 reductase [Polyangiaceae bacterium]